MTLDPIFLPFVFIAFDAVMILIYWHWRMLDFKLFVWLEKDTAIHLHSRKLKELEKQNGTA